MLLHHDGASVGALGTIFMRLLFLCFLVRFVSFPVLSLAPTLGTLFLIVRVIVIALDVQLRLTIHIFGVQSVHLVFPGSSFDVHFSIGRDDFTFCHELCRRRRRKVTACGGGRPCQEGWSRIRAPWRRRRGQQPRQPL